MRIWCQSGPNCSEVQSLPRGAAGGIAPLAQKGEIMKVVETSVQSPANVRKSLRKDKWRGLTSCKAGVVVPLAYFPLLREDRISGTVNVTVRMEETVKPLLNAVRCKVMAHLFPYSADNRFSGLEQMNASYMKQADFGGSPPPAFFASAVHNPTSELSKVLGLHAPVGRGINLAVHRAYNEIVNMRRASRSKNIPLLGDSQANLAEAFWQNPNYWHIVPDFDHAMIEGELTVPLTGQVPVLGIAVPTANTYPNPSTGLSETGGPATDGNWSDSATTAPGATPRIRQDGTNPWPGIFAELADGGATISMANMELAKQTAAFARMRDAYKGANDEYIIDMLMDGLRVPDAMLKAPILLGVKSGVFGMQERHAADYANLDQSYTTGEVRLSVPVRTPSINPGGVVLVTMEIVPESLPELGFDPFLSIVDTDDLPSYVKDFLDPEKVEIVRNEEIDAYHSAPTGVFGYAPLNSRWNRDSAHLGGKFLDAETPSISEERYRVWQVRVTDPNLDTDFYLCPRPFPHDVFADTAADPFEVVTIADMSVVGNTVFGPRLAEMHSSYDEVLAEVDQGRIVQPGQAEAETADVPADPMVSIGELAKKIAEAVAKERVSAEGEAKVSAEGEAKE